MTFAHGAIAQIPTDAPHVYAFRILGHVDDDAFDAMAAYMNDAFDRHEEVSMLLDLRGMTGRDWDAMFSREGMIANLRSLSKVARYAAVGGPALAGAMITAMDKVIPVDARAFDADEIDAAFAFVGAPVPADFRAA
ncbi:MAG: SpoIIAA family protein [Paracoccaceae bacterium]